ncbi:MAG: hypothetical protein SFY80_12170 [Verrucomicrobiota bacterium]|nr:hypothetical protein [Verrucomicrobiota bacterium]
MINDRKSNWLPTIDLHLISWDRVNEARKPKPEVLLADQYGRGNLLSEQQVLAVQLEQEAVIKVQLTEALTQRDNLHRELLELVRSYNRYFITMPKEIRVRLLVARTPSFSSGAGAVRRCVETIQATWSTYAKHCEGTPEYTPFMLSGGQTLADMLLLNENLSTVISTIRKLRQKLRKIQVEVRQLAIKGIYPRLIAYRRMVMYLYPVNHELVVSLPRLHATNPARKPVVEG